MTTKVEVRIYQCTGLRFPEPYGIYEVAILVQSDGTHQTITAPPSPMQKLKNPNPVFNRALYFDVPNLMGAYFYVSVIDSNNMGQQAVLGRVEVPLNRLASQESGVELRNLYLVQSGGDIDIGLIPTHAAPAFVPPTSPSSSSSATTSTGTNEGEDEPKLMRAGTVGPYALPKKKAATRGCIQYNPSDLNRIFPHLARGSFGVVFRGKCKGVEGIVVVKDMEIQNQNSIEEWRKEIAIMAQNKSPYIAEVFGYCSQGNILTIVMEFMDLGDLFGVLHKKAEKHPLSLIQRMRMARHCVLGIQVLHNNKIIHRDIKSMNVLVNKDYYCKITDFGCSKVSNDYNQFNTMATGTPLWMAPEVRTGNYGVPSDIYSLGLVLYELFERKLPMFDPNTQVTTLPTVFQSAPVVLPCVNLNPNARPMVHQVLEAMEKLIRSVVSTAQSKLTPEQTAACHAAAAQHMEEAHALGTMVQASEAESAAVFQLLLTLPLHDADVLCGVANPTTSMTIAKQTQATQQQVNQLQPTSFQTPTTPTTSQAFSGYTPLHQVQAAGMAPALPNTVSPMMPAYPATPSALGGGEGLGGSRRRPAQVAAASAGATILNVPATINIIIKEAEHLKPVDSNGKSDPYCKVWVNGMQYKTPTIKKNLNPKWDYNISFSVDGSSTDVALQIEVWDWNLIGHDEFLGWIDTKLDITQSNEQWLQVQAKTKKDRNITGRVRVVVTKI